MNNENIITVHNRKQFNYIFKNNSNDKLYYTFVQIFNKPFNMKEYAERQINYSIFNNIKKMAYENVTDDVIYNYIYEKLNELYYPIYGYPDKREGRSDSRIDEIKYLIYNSGINRKINTYLDFGCSEGGITSKIGDALNLTSDKITGIDIMQENKIIYNNNNFQYIQINTTDSLPIKDKEIDVVTSLMVLHHTYDPIFYIKEIYRILNNESILIIREHDIDENVNVEEKVCMDVLHGMYNVSWAKLGEQEDKDFCKNYYAKYYNREFWNNELIKAGFKRVEYKDINKYYNMNNIQRVYENKQWIKNSVYSYWGVYIKE